MPSSTVARAGGLLHNPDFLVAQAVQLVDKLVDLLIRRIDLPLERVLLIWRLRRRQILVPLQRFVTIVPRPERTSTGLFGRFCVGPADAEKARLPASGL